MSKNYAALAELDHECSGLNNCGECRTLFFHKSRMKWHALLDRMRAVREQSYHIDNRVVSAILNPKEDK